MWSPELVGVTGIGLYVLYFSLYYIELQGNAPNVSLLIEAVLNVVLQSQIIVHKDIQIAPTQIVYVIYVYSMGPG